MGKYVKIFGDNSSQFHSFVILSDGIFRVPGAHISEGPLLGIGTIIILLLA